MHSIGSRISTGFRALGYHSDSPRIPRRFRVQERQPLAGRASREAADVIANCIHFAVKTQ